MLLKKFRTGDVNSEKLQKLDDIKNRCDKFQRIQPAQIRFRVSLVVVELWLNEEVYKDIMYIKKYPVLHVVDSVTRFSSTK